MLYSTDGKSLSEKLFSHIYIFFIFVKYCQKEFRFFHKAKFTWFVNFTLDIVYCLFTYIRMQKYIEI